MGKIQIVLDEQTEKDFRNTLKEKDPFKKGNMSDEIRKLIIESLDRISYKFPLFKQKGIQDVDEETLNQIELFYQSIPTLEKEMEKGLIIFKDKKSGAHYSECHIKSSELVKYQDIDSLINPKEREDSEEQDEYRMNREIIESHPAFRAMISDAKEGRQFSDLIIEFTYDYKPKIPLKVLGGQHRIEAIRRTLKDNPNTVHGIRVYFNLNISQRIELAEIANTNINISLDLRDRMHEQGLEPSGRLRDFSIKIGIMKDKEEFAEKRLKEQLRPTVRMMRTFIVNFYEGKKYKGEIGKTTVTPYLCKSGGMDDKYKELFDKLKGNFIGQKDLMICAENFIKLHNKQLKKGEDRYKYRVLNLAVIAAWSFVAGNLQNKNETIFKLYKLPILSGEDDPLNAKDMDEVKHPTDPPNYKMGVRFGKKERGRLAQVFYRYANSEKIKKLDKKAYKEAIRHYYLNEENEDLDKGSVF